MLYPGKILTSTPAKYYGTEPFVTLNHSEPVDDTHLSIHLGKQ